MRKIKYSKVLILGVFIYIAFEMIIALIGKSTTTLVLEVETIEEVTTTQGLFIREEHLITANASGNIYFTIENGQKVKSGQKIGEIHKNGSKIDSNNKEIEKLSEELEKLQQQENSQSNSSIKTQIATKKEQIQILENQNNNNTLDINAASGGILCYKYDEKEELYNIDMLDSITKDDVEYTNSYYTQVDYEKDHVEEGEPIARIVNSNESYVAFCIENEEDENFEIDKNIKIRFNNNILNTKVSAKYQKDDYIVVILKISNQNVEIYDTRVKEFDIIYKQAEGLKIPKSCVKEIDGEPGVFVINQRTRKSQFIELKNISYENDDFILINDYRNDIEGISTVRVNDEIILKPNSINTNITMK